MSDFTLCPECLRGGVREVERSELFALGRAAGARVVKIRPRHRVAGYWWCDRCTNGGAFFVWPKQRRGA